ncbi:Tex family protein [Kushneria phyllosphaerae]|uniref:30S ribosomal protein S1 n=1 Tax=Kushneria phyllosphaerae TaxID=2100822 RepID=A0A2R8CNG1_9GAMM|nr:30S ribosomal protein S1 [Kushneria phyllosphaerae]
MTQISSMATRLAAELGAAPGAAAVRPAQIEATIALLDEGATVPFISRYRKEATGGLDDSQLRLLETRLRYLRELDERRETVLSSIEEQGKLDDALRANILAADTKQRLEDLYLPYRKKRRTKAQIAREAGLEPLADALLNDPSLVPEALATDYLDEAQGITDARAALDGARQILMERFAESPALVGRLRERLWQEAELVSTMLAGQENSGAKFSDYFDHREKLSRTPSHRALAMFRGRQEGVLGLALKLPDEDEAPVHPCEVEIAREFGISDHARPADRWLKEVVRWTWRVKLYTHLETELLGQLREQAEATAIGVFADNLKDLLLAAPAGARATLGLDPGLRTGVKVAVVDATGKVVDHTAIYPHAPRNQWEASLVTLTGLCKKHDVGLVAIGNGTASRETDRLAADLLDRLKGQDIARVMVSEAGASVYSASEFASRELPELDVTIRGAVSIARRLQDPLAELVKIDPKSIGVGQYQHDVSQLMLARSLDAVVEDCVNAVGVDLNTASSALLARVSGLNNTLADNIVAWRDRHGAFDNRRQILEVTRLGPKTFEQCAGFLRINGGSNALDASAVHPEAYPLAERIAKAGRRNLQTLIGDSDFLRGVRAAEYVDERFGLPTVSDLLKELQKPGRDPRPEFRAAQFQEGVEKVSDLVAGMVLEGVITNVTHFGAFVDVGVHQDGLVHISALSHQFVQDPRSVVKAGDVVRVKVMSVDLARQRIALSMRLDDTPEAEQGSRTEGAGRREQGRPQKRRSEAASSPEPIGALGAALLKAGAGKPRDRNR